MEQKGGIGLDGGLLGGFSIVTIISVLLATIFSATTF